MEVRHGGDWAGFQARYGCPPLDFSASISPLGLPEGVRRAVIAALKEADRYPDPQCRALRARLGEYHHPGAYPLRQRGSGSYLPPGFGQKTGPGPASGSYLRGV